MRISIALLALAIPLGANRAAPVAFAVDLSPATEYTVASHATGCPEWVLRGIHGAESSFGANLNHSDPNDVGEYGINQRFQVERDRKFGRLDPRDPAQASILAGLIIMENYARLDNIGLAISAYQQGLSGLKRNGPNREYVAMVRRNG